MQTYPKLPKFWQVPPFKQGLDEQVSEIFVSQSSPVYCGEQTHWKPNKDVEGTLIFWQIAPFKHMLFACWQVSGLGVHCPQDLGQTFLTNWNPPLMNTFLMSQNGASFIQFQYESLHTRELYSKKKFCLI